MKDVKKTLIWITDILKMHHIPFQISGGLAARAYGATRPIADIDIDIPNDKFELIKLEVSEYIVFGPAQYLSEKWDLFLMTLNYHDQEVDLSGAYHTKFLNHKTGEWQELNENLVDAVSRDVLGLQLPVIPKHKLIAYKKALARPVDIMDVNELE